MTRSKAKEMLPIIQAFADGECIEYWDSLEIVGPHHRGLWRTAESMGMGASISYYRMIKLGMIHYFDGRKPVNDTLNKYSF